MNIVLLGAGEEAVAAAASLISAGHTLVGIGPQRLYADLDVEGAVLVNSHNEIDYSIVDNVLMISYPDIIGAEHIAKANYFNIHFALLPKYRGFHPVQWALINGENKIGYTLHKVDIGVDSGPIFFQGEVSVTKDDDYSTARAKVIGILRSTLGGAVSDISKGKQPEQQDESQASFFCKRSATDGLVDWSKPVYDIYNLIRAIAPPAMPGAHFFYKGTQVHIKKSEIVPVKPYIGPTGKVVSVLSDRVYVKAGDGVIALFELVVDGLDVSAPQLIKKIGIDLNG